MKESERVREKPRTVIDTSVFVAAIFWQGSARECLVRFARREFQLFVTESVLEEYAETAWELKMEDQAYEQRIEHLIQELRVTKEESRALIRAQIVQIKAEMEAARAKLLAEAEQHAVTE